MDELPDRIHVTGASGSGTTSLGRLIADRYGHRHVDTDDFYWLPTDPPYTRKRPVATRLELLDRALAGCDRWVLTGSLVDWGDPLIPRFQLVVYLFAPTGVRLARLRAREAERYGEHAIAPGGERHDAAEAFLEWASRYDDGGPEIRSRTLHDAWLVRVGCPVVRVDARAPVRDTLAMVEDAYARMKPPHEPPVAGDEVETMLGSLERQRRTFRWKSGGLDAAGLNTKIGASAITLGGLLKHLALVEDDVFAARLHGRDLGPEWHDHDGRPDWEWRSAAGDTPQQLYALWDGAVARSRVLLDEALSKAGLDFPGAITDDDGTHATLRRLLADLIEEYARHVGHADLIRESIDGLIGEDPPRDFELST
jgi:adenylate kinase family enzyme